MGCGAEVSGAYVLLQFSWWAYLLVSTGGPEAKWMVLGGHIFATLLLVGLFRLSAASSGNATDWPRNLLLGVTHGVRLSLRASIPVWTHFAVWPSDEDRKGC